jgi:hypothetical protein
MWALGLFRLKAILSHTGGFNQRFLRKYMLIFRAVDYKVAPILEHDWKSIFRTAWL